MTTIAIGNEMPYGVTFRRVIRSEWTKFWSLRSTWIVLGATALVTIGLAAVIGSVQRGQANDEATAVTLEQVAGGAFLGVDLFSLVIGVSGVLMMTGEYSSGLIRATLAAVPRRLPVLWAKALVLVGVTAVVMLVVCFGAFLASRATSGADVALDDATVLRAVLGAAAAPVAFGVIGLGLGTALRHTAGSITTLVTILLVVPSLLPAALPDAVHDDVAPYSPVAAAQAMYSVDGSGGGFEMASPGVAALVVVGWSALALAAGAVVLNRRDA
ncbi:hypothetical protein Kfla_2338 [Kribbella flavida DSM 17836]|uniref:ABC transporter transmembrane protein n=1 Tax=Kribbella flavida (strain DSM 17836 / JCM 10339 / NBRC 14399) TaxID=479435 RepID=D2PUU8_KRIFD|nr:ABC transporter permease subunit [Kribbella flavida]ADB31414.1 hypothetical protein Kfla_2338 [Kribbella flavida DSM 17836]